MSFKTLGLMIVFIIGNAGISGWWMADASGRLGRLEEGHVQMSNDISGVKAESAKMGERAATLEANYINIITSLRRIESKLDSGK